MICSSSRPCGGSDYCFKCSHANYQAEGTDKNGELWKWEFNPMFGPTFLKDNGKIIYPIERSLAWDVSIPGMKNLRKIGRIK